jgi:O-antigen ligase
LKGLRALVVAMSCAGAILGLIALFEAARSWPLFEIMYQRLGVYRFGVVVKMRHGLIRPYGPMLEPTDLGFVLALCLAAVLAARREFVKRANYLLVLALVAGGVLATQSRGGLVGAMLVCIAVPLYRRGVRGIVEYLLLVPVAAILYAVMTFIGPDVGRLSDPTIQGSVDYRAELLRRGLEEYWRNPWFGASFSHVVHAMSDMLQGEGIVDFVNSYLYFALMGGIVGVLLFIATLLWPLARVVLMRPQLAPGSAKRDMGAFCAASIAAAAAMFAFTSFLPRSSILFIMIAVAAFTLDPVRQARRLAARHARVMNPTLGKEMFGPGADGGLRTQPIRVTPRAAD